MRTAAIQVDERAGQRVSRRTDRLDGNREERPVSHARARGRDRARILQKQSIGAAGSGVYVLRVLVPSGDRTVEVIGLHAMTRSLRYSHSIVAGGLPEMS